MPPVEGFCGPTYEATSPIIDAELAINLFCERSESQGARTPIALILAPGKSLFASLPEAGVTCLYTVNGRTFAAGSQLYELNAAGAITVRGSLGGTIPVRPCMMFANETQLLCLNNGNLYILTLATNAFAAVNMAQLVGGPDSVAQIGFADGFFFAWFLNTHTFQQSKLEDGLTWSALDASVISLFPDNLMSMICDHREMWLFSGKKSTGYYNAGAGFPSYIPIQGAFAEFGAGAMSATVQADNTVCWIGQDERGAAVAYRLQGYSNQRISTHAVEAAWQNYTTITDARGYSYQEDGHTFWVIYFPTGNATWVYDFSTGFWHQRGNWNVVAGIYEADHSQSHTYNFGKHLVGDWASGNVYEQATSIYSDNGGILRGLRRSPTVNNSNKWVYFSEFELDIEPGITPIPPFQGSDQPTVLILQSANGTLYGFSIDNFGIIQSTVLTSGSPQQLYLNDNGTGTTSWHITVDNFGNIVPVAVALGSYPNGMQFVSTGGDKLFQFEITAAPLLQVTATGIVGRQAQVMLRWSDDGSKTWSNTYLLNCGFAGEYNARARKVMLGRGRKRIWEVAVTDPVAWRLANAYVVMNPSTERT